jgi:hypothetical protein
MGPHAIGGYAAPPVGGRRLRRGIRKGMTIILVHVLITVVGALVYALAANTKAAELGRIMFACGLFWFVAGLAGHVARLG